MQRAFTILLISPHIPVKFQFLQIIKTCSMSFRYALVDPAGCVTCRSATFWSEATITKQVCRTMESRKEIQVS